MPLDLARIRAVLFDVDGTLRDTDDQFVMQVAGWLRPAGFLFTGRDPQHFARWMVMRTETLGTWAYSLPDRLGLDGYLNRLGDWLDRRGSTQNRKPYLAMEGTADFLARLAACYPLGIVSARGERITRVFLESTGLLPFLGCIVSGQTCRYTKPHPEPVLWAARHLGVLPETCLMVGDTTVDIRAGRAAGAQTAGVLCGFGEEAELRQAGADCILPRTTDLAEMLLPKPVNFS